MSETRETCETCRFNGGLYNHPDADMGTPAGFKCVRRAPVATGGMMSRANTIWPKVEPDDWCGEWTALRKAGDKP